MKFILIYFATFLCFSSCVNTSPRGKNVDSAKLDSYQEDLGKVRPRTAWEKPEELLVKEEPIELSSYKLDEPKSENTRINEAIKKIASYNSSISEMPGYRIQVYSGNSRPGFEQAKSYILQHFPDLEIYESYSQPTYRVKVGDFLKKMNAEMYYSSLVGRFSAAKIIMDNVDVQKSLKIN